MTNDELIGTRWRGASGGIFIVDKVTRNLAYGHWDSGGPWVEFTNWLPKLYTQV